MKWNEMKWNEMKYRKNGFRVKFETSTKRKTYLIITGDQGGSKEESETGDL